LQFEKNFIIYDIRKNDWKNLNYSMIKKLEGDILLLFNEEGFFPGHGYTFE